MMTICASIEEASRITLAVYNVLEPARTRDCEPLQAQYLRTLYRSVLKLRARDSKPIYLHNILAETSHDRV